MRYLIDTNILIPYFAGDAATIRLLKHLTPEGIAVSILSYLELYQGVIESANPEDARDQFDGFFSDMEVYSVSPAVARKCAEIRSDLKKRGRNTRRRAFDLVIAATALEHGLELVTRNTKDYRDVTGLTLYQI